MTPWTGSRVSPLPLTSVKCGSVGDTSRKIWKKIGFKRTTNKQKYPKIWPWANQWYCTLPQLAYITTSTYHIEFMIVTCVQRVYMNQQADKKDNQCNDLKLTQSFIIDKYDGLYPSLDRIFPYCSHQCKFINNDWCRIIHQSSDIVFVFVRGGENHLLSHDLGWESCQLFQITADVWNSRIGTHTCIAYTCFLYI